jgi:hypothetical protein
LLPKTPTVFHGVTRAPSWLELDRATGLRFCCDSCRAAYVVDGGTPFRFAVQPKTLAEAEIAFNSEADSPTLPPNGNWVAVPDSSVVRDLPTRFVVAALIAPAMLLLGLADWPYGYYQLLRILVCAVAVWGAFLAHRTRKSGWMWLLGSIAVVFNPVFPIHLERQVWTLIDVAVAVVLVSSLRLLSPVRDTPAVESSFPWWETREEINKSGPSAPVLATDDRPLIFPLFVGGLLFGLLILLSVVDAVLSLLPAGGSALIRALRDVAVYLLIVWFALMLVGYPILQWWVEKRDFRRWSDDALRRNDPEESRKRDEALNP